MLVLSALSAVDERVRGLKAGGDDYLSKPFALSELAAAGGLRRGAGSIGLIAGVRFREPALDSASLRRSCACTVTSSMCIKLTAFSAST